MIRLVLLVGQTLLKQYEEQKSTEDLNSFSLYVKKLVRKHELWIACNAAFPEAIIAIRHSLKDLLPQNRITVFHLPFKEDKEQYQIESNRLVQEYFLSQLHPDLLLSMDLNSNKKNAGNCYVSLHRMKKKKSHFHKDNPPKPTLAYFSPVPPAKSGIANYSSELLPYLSIYYDITLIVDQKVVENRYREQDFKILSLDDFIENNEKFDRILYHFGNSFYHSYMWSMLKQYPGVVVLHDFFLSGLLSYEEIVNDKTAFWTEQLFKSHGYHALGERFTGKTKDEVKYQYPCNYEVLQHALGMIVHSEYSKNLAKQWYSINPSKEWQTIPLLREPVKTVNKKDSRKTLGFSEDDLIICSFGLLNATKLNHRLIQAFLDSELSKNSNCFLVFVGENNSGEYAFELEKAIIASPAKDRIRITGWTDDNVFHNYLNIADIGVQLRTASRGESSASVLDCMNYGIPTIVNANGSMSDLPHDALYMLEDNFKTDTLVDALDTLGYDIQLRKNLGEKAKKFIQTYHDPIFCASRYHEVIETTYQSHSEYTSLIHSLSTLRNLPKQSSVLDILAESIARSTQPNLRQKQLLIDVSAVVRTDLRTGIERMVRAQLLELIRTVPVSVRVEPIYLCEEGGLHYRYARNFTSAMLNLPVHIKEEPVKVENGDIFYGLDFYRDGTAQAANEGIYTHWSALGVSINFAVYDLLPIKYPEFFPEGSELRHAQWLEAITSVSDSLICISQTVADELKNWISTHTKKQHIEIEAVHLGSDIKASSPSSGLPDETASILSHITEKPTFLMVGTIEPRKGHLQTIAAFEKLWNDNIDINLVIVGKEGWKGLPDPQRRTIPEIIEKLHSHPQINKHLFWLEGISDLFLEKLYQASSALIAASEDEGFGLPLIEAAYYGLPIIARDIPVFKEVASDNAFYFSNSKEPLVLSDAITVWLEAYQKNDHIPSDTMAYITWEKSTQQLIETLLVTKERQETSIDEKRKKKEKHNDIINTSELKNGQDIDQLPPRAKEIYHNLIQIENRKEKQ